MVVCKMLLHHADGRIEETEVRGEGPIMPGALFRLAPTGEQWWKVVSVKWPAEGRGEAELEPTELPPHLAALEPS